MENDQFKKIDSKLKTQLLDRYFVVACLLGLTKVRPNLGFFLSQALPVGFESGQRDRFVWFEIRDIAKVSKLSDKIIKMRGGYSLASLLWCITFRCFLLVTARACCRLGAHRCASAGATFCVCRSIYSKSSYYTHEIQVGVCWTPTFVRVTCHFRYCIWGFYKQPGWSKAS